MNINPIIEAAFKDFGVPIAFLKYTGKSETYLVYYTWLEQPENFSDNDYHAEPIYLTIDVFSKGNFKNILKQVKKIMEQSGFTWTNNGPEIYEDETDYYHVPLNFCAESALISRE